VDIQAGLGEQATAETRDKNGQAIAFPTDVSYPVEKPRRTVIDRFGKIQILVNAAIPVNKVIVDTTPEEWNRQMAVNVGGVFLCSRQFPPPSSTDAWRNHQCFICERLLC
jgi:NAD(P)-dependent dehydrogenase (short-subunit alcohol dehydrogenase family)